MKVVIRILPAACLWAAVVASISAQSGSATKPAPQGDSGVAAKPTLGESSEAGAATSAAPLASDKTERARPTMPDESFLGRWTRRLLATITW